MILRKLAFLIITFFYIASAAFYAQEKPSLCFTFDDGNSSDILNYDCMKLNQMILDTLKNYELHAAFYVCGKNLDNTNGKAILESWDDAGHLIANHTYNHFNYNKRNISYELYKNDILKCDSIISSYKNYSKYFRAPYLKNGETEEKRDSLIDFLNRINYKNGYVTIDCSDWFYNSRMINHLKENAFIGIDAYRKPYIEHILEQAKYYDDLAYEILGRKVKHSLLLHHNLTSALFLGDLIRALKDEGWELINAGDALTDEVYERNMNTLPAGESIIWSIAKETGKYDDNLRYPGEDSVYEEERMNRSGL